MKRTEQLLILFLVSTPAVAFGQEDVRAGLFAEARQIPLVAQSIDVRIEGGEAVIELVQVFENEDSKVAQADYFLHLPEQGSVEGFGFWNEGRFFAAKLGEKSEAESKHREAAAAGRTTALGKKDAGIHSFSVYPLAAGERKQVETRLRMPVVMELGRRHIRVPIERFLGQAPIRSTVRIQIDASAPIVDFGAEAVELRTLAKQTTHLDLLAATRSPLELWWREEGPPISMSAEAVEIPEGDHAIEIGAVFNHAEDSDQVARKLIGLVDTSFSMKKRKAAVLRALARLERHARAPVELYAIGAEARRLSGRSPEELGEQLFDTEPTFAIEADDIVRMATQLGCSRSEIRCLVLSDPQLEGLDSLGPAELDAILIADAHERAYFRGKIPGAMALFDASADPWAKLDTLVDERTRSVLSLVAVSQGAMSLELPGDQNRRVAEGGMLRLFARTGSLEPIEVEAIVDGRSVRRVLQATVHPAGSEAATRVRRGLYRQVLERWMEQYRRDRDPALKKRIVELSVREEIPTDLTAMQVDAPSTSLYAIKPGDPTLTVHGEAGLAFVEVHYPFGESRRMVFDSEADVYLDRFLAPRGWKDQVYRIEVFKHFEDGRVKIEHAYYQIDSQGESAVLSFDAELGVLSVETGEGTRDISTVSIHGRGRVVELSPLGSRWSISRTELPDRFTVALRDRAGNRTLYFCTLVEERLEVDMPSSEHGRDAPSLALELQPLRFGTSTARLEGRQIVWRHEDRIHRFDYDGRTIRSLDIRAAIARGDGRIVIGTAAGDLVSLTCKEEACSARRLSDRFGEHAITGLADLGKGRVLVGVLGEGLFELDAHDRLRPSDLRTGSRFITAVVPAGKEILVGTMYDGLWRIVGRRAIKSRFGSKHVASVERVDGQIVIASGSGRYLRKRRDQFESIPAAPALPDESAALSSAVSIGGRLFVGGFDSGLFENKRGVLLRLPFAKRPKQAHINQLASFGGSLWVASEDGLDRVDIGGSSLSSIRILDGAVSDLDVGSRGLAVASSRGVFVIDAEGRTERWDFQKGIGEARLGSVAWHQGALFAGGMDGLFRLDGKVGAAIGVAEGYRAGWVTALESDGAQLVVGTYDEGVYRYAEGRAAPVLALRDQWVPMQAIRRLSDGLWIGGLGMPPVRLSTDGSVRALGVPSRDVNGFIESSGRRWMLSADGLIEMSEPRRLSRAP